MRVKESPREQERVALAGQRIAHRLQAVELIAQLFGDDQRIINRY